MIPQDIIEELRQRIDLVGVVEQIVPVKRSGTSYMACCPFHDEKTPSFHISQAKQLFHCFGCGVGGNVYHFLMKYYHLQFPEALEYVAREVGFDLEPYKKQSPGVKKDHALEDILAYACERYHEYLKRHSQAQGARDYLTQRGITPETIEKFRLGFVPQGWDHLSKAMVRDQKSLIDAQKAGLVAPRKKDPSQFYDVFRQRLMVPIQNAKGVIIGFGGRAMGDENPKYLNSPQTDAFDKSKVLYGLSHAENAIRTQKNVYVVEGYFDQMMLFQSGIENVVATMGTATTTYHSMVLKRYSPRFTLVFDGDQAGLNACRKAAKSILTEGIDADVMLMPQGCDPDDFVRKNGKEAFMALPVTPLMDYLIENFYAKSKDLTDKTNFLKEMVDWVGQARNPYIGKVLKDEMIAKMDLDPRVFSQQRVPSAAPSAQNIKPSPQTLKKEEVMLAILYAQSADIQSKMDSETLINFLTDPGLKEYVTTCLNDPQAENDPTKWIDHWENPVYKAMLTQTLLTLDLHMEEASISKIWDDCFVKVQKVHVHNLVEQIQKAERAGDLGLVGHLSKKVMELKNYKPVNV